MCVVYKRGLSGIRTKTLLFHSSNLTDNSGVPPLGIATLIGVLKERGYNRIDVVSYNIRGKRIISKIVTGLPTLSKINININLYASQQTKKENIHYPPLTANTNTSPLKNPGRIRDIIISKKPNIVGISIFYPEDIFSAITISRIVKRINRQVFVVWGGPTTTKKLKNIMKIRNINEIVDGFIVGDGGSPLAELIYQIEHKGNLNTVPNLFFKKDRTYQKSKSSCNCLGDLKTIPDFGRQKNIKWVYVRASVGCHWAKCTFCSYPTVNREYNVLNINHFIDMLKHLKRKHNIRGFSLMDDSPQPGFLRELSKRLIDEKLGIRWNSYIPITKALDENTVKLMVKSGIFFVRLGVESVSPRILRKMNKSHKRDDVFHVLNLLKKHNIRTSVYMMFGFPGETRGDAVLTLRFLSKHKNLYNMAMLNKFSLEENTPIFNNPDRYGIKILDGNMDWRMGVKYASLKGPKEEQIIRNMRIARRITGKKTLISMVKSAHTVF